MRSSTRALARSTLPNRRSREGAVGEGPEGEPRVNDWRRIKGGLRRTRSFVVKGHLSSGDIRGPETEFTIEAPVHGGVPASVEGITSQSAWSRLTDPLRERRLGFLAKNGSTQMESDDAVPNGSSPDGPDRVRFSLTLNSLRETTSLTNVAGLTTEGVVMFGGVPFFRPTFDPRKNKILAARTEINAAGWRFRVRPLLSHPVAAPEVDGLVLPARLHVSMRSDQLTDVAGRSTKGGLALVREVADDVAAALTVMSHRRVPWMYSELLAIRGGGQHARFSQPAVVRGGRFRSGLIDHRACKLAFGAALRTLLRFRGKAPHVAEVLGEAIFLFASAAEEQEPRRSWYSMAICLDVLRACGDLRASRTRQRRHEIKVVRGELADLVNLAKAERMSSETQRRLAQARGELERTSFREGIHALIRAARVDVSDLGGDALVSDIVEIRNQLMHRGDLPSPQVDRIEKRGVERGLGFPRAGLPRGRVAAQLLYERREPALRLIARVLLRILRVPDRAAPAVWDADVACELF